MRDQSPFAYPIYRSLWYSNLASSAGILIQSVGVSWIVVESGASAQEIALVQTAASLPLVLLSPLAGALSDVMDRRLVMIGAQSLLVFVSISLVTLAWTQAVSPTIMIACTFLAGCSLALNGPAWLASIGDILPRSAIPVAIIYNSIGNNFARTIGPALGGLAVALADARLNFSINVISSLILIVTLLRWRTSSPNKAISARKLADAIWQGMRFAARKVPIRTPLWRAFLFGAVGSGMQALLPVIARDLLNGGSAVFGILFASFGLGAVCGAVIVGRMHRRRTRAETTVRLCTIVLASATICIAYSSITIVTVGCLILAGAAWVAGFATLNVSVQLASPRWIVARTLSLYQMAVYGGVALGSWLGGWIANQVGTAPSVAIGGLLAFASMGAGWIAPLPPVRDHGPS